MYTNYVESLLKALLLSLPRLLLVRVRRGRGLLRNVPSISWGLLVRRQATTLPINSHLSWPL